MCGCVDVWYVLFYFQMAQVSAALVSAASSANFHLASSICCYTASSIEAALSMTGPSSTIDPPPSLVDNASSVGLIWISRLGESNSSFMSYSFGSGSFSNSTQPLFASSPPFFDSSPPFFDSSPPFFDSSPPLRTSTPPFDFYGSIGLPAPSCVESNEYIC